MSIHIFLGLPCLFVPCTYPWMIHSLHMIKILHSPLLYAICHVLVDHPSHTALFLIPSLQSSSNRTFQISLICFLVFLLCLGENEHGNRISGANFCIVFHFTYGSILFTFRNMTTGRTTDDGLTDRRRQETHIWPLRRACRLQRQL